MLIVVGGGIGGYLLYRTPVDQWGDAVRYPNLEIYHGKGVSQDEAEALGRFVQARQIATPGNPVTLRLARQDEGYALYLFVDYHTIHDPMHDALRREIRDAISREVFDGKPVRLLLCNPQVVRGGMGALGEPEVWKVID